MSDKTWAIIFIAVILTVLTAFTWAQEVPKPSDWVKISAKPDTIQADGVSTSTIRVIVTWPNETELSGEPAANQTLTIWTNCGLLFDATNESNTGRSINVTTDDNGTATALLSGNETCNATVTVSCLSGGWNFTQVSFIAPEPSPSPGESGAVNESGGEGGTTTQTPSNATNETNATNVSPEATPAQTATPIPTTTPAVSPSETTAPTSPVTTPAIPGFGVALTIVSLLAVFVIAYLRRR
ncbi:MAG: hypothetical protein N2V71_02125 [Methanophagales archaeon]|nr:hypothetical protein [Methanophagales archaeon]MCW7069148.1 hypothetical protein [Methanophagales archaeon]